MVNWNPFWPLPLTNTTAGNGAVTWLQFWPLTVPAILPQPLGGVTFIVTGTGLRVCGVLGLVSRICAVSVPGCVTWSAVVALRVTVTLTVPPTGTVTWAGLTLSHGTLKPFTIPKIMFCQSSTSSGIP